MTDVPDPPRSGADEDDKLEEAGEGTVEAASGALFASLGILGIFISRGYASGTALNMGPGYVPQAVAWALLVLGVLGIVRGFLIGGWQLPRVAVRPLLCITCAILVFAAMIDRFGLFAAAFATALIGSAAQTPMSWRRAPLIALALSGFCALLFGYVLKLSIPVWPR